MACRSAMFLFSSLGRGIEQVRVSIVTLFIKSRLNTSKFVVGDLGSSSGLVHKLYL